MKIVKKMLSLPLFFKEELNIETQVINKAVN
jgi:hypothetical protein